MSPWPHVTVIVPAWNAAATIGPCLEALMAQDYPPESYAICVVDNGSRDSTVERVRGFAGVHLLHEAEPGSYAARNRGLAVASGDYVAFTDADCLPAKDWLSAGMAVARAHPDAGVVGGRIDLFRPPDGGAVAAAYERMFAFRQDRTVAAGRAATANWLSPTAMFDRVGGFDAMLRSGGDYELCGRVRSSGMTVVYAPDMVVRHPSRPSIAALAAKRRRTSGGQWQAYPHPAQRLRYLAGVPFGVWNDLRTVARARDLSSAVRLGIVGVVVWLAAMQLFQPLRMLLGASAPRS